MKREERDRLRKDRESMRSGGERVRSQVREKRRGRHLGMGRKGEGGKGGKERKQLSSKSSRLRERVVEVREWEREVSLDSTGQRVV